MSYTAANVDKILRKNIFIDEMDIAIRMPFSPQ